MLSFARFKLSLVGIINPTVFSFSDSGGVHQSFKVGKGQDTQLGLQDLMHPFEETVLLLFLSVGVIPCIAGQLVELVQEIGRASCRERVLRLV